MNETTANCPNCGRYLRLHEVDKICGPTHRARCYGCASVVIIVNGELTTEQWFTEDSQARRLMELWD